jgi:hypothetical protein
MDAACLFKGAYLATDTVDGNDLDSNQTAGAPIVLTTSNVLNMFTVAARKLSVNNVDGGNRFFAISPQVKEKLLAYLSGRESQLGDSTGEAGNIGRYMGFSLFETNNLTAMIRITPSGAASDGGTLVINGLTLTFRDTPAAANCSATAWDVDDNGTATVAGNITNMVAVINNTSGVDTAAVGFRPTLAGLAAFDRGWFAVNGTTYIDIYIKGASYIAALSGTATTYTGTNVTYYKQINLCGEKGAIDFVIQKEPSAQMASTVSAGKAGMNVLVLDLFAVGVFQDMKARLFGVEVDSSVF